MSIRQMINDGYFKDRGRLGYLGKYPLSLIDPIKRIDADRFRGTTYHAIQFKPNN